MSDKRKHKNKSPLIARGLLELFLRSDLKEQRLGDYEEIFKYKTETDGVVKAKLWYWNQTLRSIPKLIYDSVYWGIAMFLNYLKVALRGIRKQKTYSFVNIVGLALAMASCIILSLWIINQLSYDKFHENSESIYQVLMQGNSPDNPSTPWPLAQALKEDFPEVDKSTRIGSFNETLVNYGSKSFYENNILTVDPDFFKIFSFPFISGNPASAFNDIHAVVLTKSMAEKYFGQTDVVGKTLVFDGQNNMIVAGVVDDVPQNSSIQFDMLVPVEYKIATNRTGFEMSWGWWSPNTIVKLNSGVTSGDINQKIDDYLIVKKIEEEPPRLSVIPFTDSYMFFSGMMDSIYIFIAIVLFLIGIACFNFINLSTAQASNRAKEIGIRHVAGAYRTNLISQFLSESLLISFIALILALVISLIALPFINSWLNLNLSFGFDNGFMVLLIALILTILTGLIAGVYPALVLSSFKPAKVLSGEFKSGNKGIVIRKVLITIQFGLTVFLLIATAIMKDQLQYFLGKDIGYNKENLISISLKGGTSKSYTSFKNKLITEPGVINVTGSNAPFPYFNWSSGSNDWEGKDPNLDINTSNNFVDYDFFETFGVDFISGRKFSREFTSDTGWVFIINEEMQKIMNTNNALGKRLTYWGNVGTIIGVTKNFHFKSFYNRLEPLVLMLRPSEIENAYIRIAGNNIPTTLASIEKAWSETNPNYPFEFSFVDQQIDNRYRRLERQSSLINIFAIIAIFTACLGLFGLASFVALQKVKEIGIRKVHGATVINILALFTWKFLPELIIANLIAWPLAYYFMSDWLQDFVYRISLSLWTFVLAAITALIIAIGTISYHSIKAANTNPIDSIKYE